MWTQVSVRKDSHKKQNNCFMEEMIYKIFKDERTVYFHSSDAHRMETGETWITYEYFNGNRKKVTLIFGSDNFDEVPLRVCTTPDELESLVNSLIN